ncbi:NYN domain-containing protein [Bradyrhizobium liaoningense]|uniref:NYN domain-containing protein n=1 Tax=Bradyrhizobium liaoningense TaxID=43992 RepID=UPI001FD34186|nr:NYN domain-containing protein [Bradyrhizobium liaoningense]
MKVAVLIDGGHLRVQARMANHRYDPDFIEKVAHTCVEEKETLLRVLYYDCPPFNGEVKLPVSGETTTFKGSDKWLRELAAKDLFAVRRGVLKFRGYKPKKIPVVGKELTDDDFAPDFEQKGVDMRIGLDMANFAADRTVDRIILVTGDTDCVPAMKNCRIRGLQVILAALPGHTAAQELLWHSDIHRTVNWPSQPDAAKATPASSVPAPRKLTWQRAK